MRRTASHCIVRVSFTAPQSVHTLSLLSSLALFWLLLSGHYNALLLSLGAGSCALVAWLCWRMDIVDRESHPNQLGRKMPRYWFALTWDTLVANWEVAKAVLWRSRVQPVTGYVATPLEDDVVRATLANSITLTPGTLTLDVQDRRMRVHALHPDFLKDLRQGAMVSRAHRLER